LARERAHKQMLQPMLKRSNQARSHGGAFGGNAPNFLCLPKLCCAQKFFCYNA